jgi:DNA polymerase-3 subunit beta
VSEFEITVAKSALAPMLSHAAGIANEKSPLPILKSILLEASADLLTSMATDSYRGVNESVVATCKQPGKLAVNAQRFYEVARNLEGSVSLKQAGDHLEVRAGKARLRVPILRHEDFPQLPSAADATLLATLDARDVLRLLAQGSYASGAGGGMTQLESTFMEFDGKAVHFVSTDRNRMAAATHVVDCVPGKMLVPTKAVGDLRRIVDGAKDGKVEFRLGGSTAFFTVGDVTLNVKLIDSPFCPWRSFFDTKVVDSTTLHREMLAGMVRRISAVSDHDDGGVVYLAFSTGCLRVYGSSKDAGEGEDFLDCNATFERTIGLNPSYLVQLLESIPDDEVIAEMGSPTDPFFVRGAVTSECKALCMPRHPKV